MGLPGSTLDHQGVMDFFDEGYFELFGIQIKPKNIRFFATEFGFDENQTVALLGAHTLGQVGKKTKKWKFLFACLVRNVKIISFPGIKFPIFYLSLVVCIS